jgi:hypothetical protein
MLGRREHDLLRTELEKNEQQKNNLGWLHCTGWTDLVCAHSQWTWKPEVQISCKNDGRTNRWAGTPGSDGKNQFWVRENPGLTDTRARTANSPREQISGENGPAANGPKENQSGKSLSRHGNRWSLMHSGQRQKPEKQQWQRLRIYADRKNPQAGTEQTLRSTVTTKKKIRWHEHKAWTQNCSKVTPDLTGGYTKQSSLNPKYGTHIWWNREEKYEQQKESFH